MHHWRILGSTWNEAQSLLWYVDQDQLLSTVAHGAISNPANDLVLSAASVWEIAIKVGLGKLKLSLTYRQWMTKAMADVGVVVLPISVEYADLQSRLPRHHGDPFDRLIVAQCIVEGGAAHQFGCTT
jgi:PIN domain nuclease of toxin-antitoxin system